MQNIHFVNSIFVYLIIFVLNFCYFSVFCESKCINCTIITREEYKNNEDTYKNLRYLVPKCCNINERLQEIPGKPGAQCADASNEDLIFQPILNWGNQSGFQPSQRINYTSLNVVVGNPCLHGKYPLNPRELSADEYYILYNGYVFVPNVESSPINMERFCLEYYQPPDSDDYEITPFMCFETSTAETPNSGKRVFLYAVGLLISVPFLLCTFFVYILIPELRNVHGKCLSCHVICLAVAFSALASVQLAGEHFPQDFCVGIAFLIQFSFVACFFWLNVMCFDNWFNLMLNLRSGVSKDQEERHFFWYSIYAWGCPLLLLIITLIMDLHPAVPASYIKPRFGEDVCWFNSDKAALPYFYAPVGVIVVFNIILFFLTANQLSSTVHATRAIVDVTHTNEFVKVLDMKYRWQKYKKLFRLCFFLFVIMGLSWSMEVVSWLVDGTFGIWTVFDIVNALQGVLIFCIFVLQKPVRQLVLRKIRSAFGYSNESSPVSSQSELQQL